MLAKRQILVWTFAATAICVLLWTKRRIEPRLAADVPEGPALTVAQAELHGVSLKRFSLGFDAVLADLLWIRLLQEADHSPVEEGRVSWEYTQLQAISRLQPRFPQVYPFGASYLSVFRRDEHGAKAFLHRWNAVEPRNWKAPYTLAYHLYYEMGEYEEAARWMLHAAQNLHAPPWLSSLGIRLLSESSGHLQALQMAVNLIPAVSHPVGKERLKRRIRSLRFQLQKSLWEEALERYRAEKGAPQSLADLRGHFQQGATGLAGRFPASTVPREYQSLFTERFDFKYDPESGTITSARNYGKLETPGIHRPRSFPHQQ